MRHLFGLAGAFAAWYVTKLGLGDLKIVVFCFGFPSSQTEQAALPKTCTPMAGWRRRSILEQILGSFLCPGPNPGGRSLNAGTPPKMPVSFWFPFTQQPQESPQ